MRTQHRRRSISDFSYAPLVAALAAVLAPQAAQAATIVVNDNSDLSIYNIGAGDVTLRGAIDNCTDGDTITFFHNGGQPFVISQATEMDIGCAGITIDGGGTSTNSLTYIEGASGGQSGYAFLANNSTGNVMFRGLDISGWTYGTALGGYLNADSNIIHANQTGIYIEYGGSTVTNNTIYSNGVGIEVDNVTSATIANNTIGLDASGNPGGNTEEGICLRNATATITTNVIASNSLGIEVNYGGGISIAANTIFSNENDGIDIYSVTDITVTGNTIGLDTSGSSAGNFVDGIYANTSAATITGNTISNSEEDGIYLDFDVGSTISGNKLGTDALGANNFGNWEGMYLNQAVGTTINNANIIANSYGAGIFIDAGSSGITIDGNKIGTDSSGDVDLSNDDGITAYCSSGLSITNNRIAAWNDHGIQFNGITGGGTMDIVSNAINVAGDGVTPLGGSSYGVMLLNNNCVGRLAVPGKRMTAGKHKKKTAVRMKGAVRTKAASPGATTNVMIQGNTIGNASFDGIYVDDADATKILSNNIIFNDGNGIELQGGTTNTTIDSNTISDSGSDGILIDNASATSITANNITSNGAFGVDITAGTGNMIRDNPSIFGNHTSAFAKNVNLDFPGAIYRRDDGTPDPTHANNGMTPPIITGASVDYGTGQTTVTFTLAAPPGSYEVQVCDNPAGTTEPGCKNLQGSNSVSVPASPPGTGSVSFPGTTLDNFSAIAISAANDTSEFSEVFTIVPAPNVTFSATTLPFGNIQTGGSSSPMTVTLLSSGATPYHILAMGSPTCTAGVGSIFASGPFSGSNGCSTGTAYNPGISCSITATFMPTTLGPVSQTIQICDDSPSGGGTISITGTGVAPPPVVFNPTTFGFGSLQQGATGAAQAFSLFNSGTVAVTLGAPSVNITGFVIANNTCPASLAPSAGCEVDVAFSPGGVGPFSGILSMVTGTGTTTSTLTGTGTTPPPVPFNPLNFNFGSQLVGTTGAMQKFSLFNSGSVTVPLGVASVNDVDFIVVSNTCTTSLAPNAGCEVDVAFSPLSVGNVSGTLSMPAAGATASAALSGTGAAPVMVAFNPNSYDFGAVRLGTRGTPQAFSLLNTNATPVPLGVANVDDVNFVIVDNTCTPSLAPNASCEVDVAFSPSSFGVVHGLLTMPAGVSVAALPAKRNVQAKTAGPATGATAVLTGTGSALGALSLPGSVDLGTYTLGSAPNVSIVTLGNSGDAPVNFSSISVTGPFGLKNGCPATLLAGAACSVTLTYSSSTLGNATGTLVIQSDAAGGSGAIPLKANTVAVPVPILNITPTQIGFGDRLLGSTSIPSPITISNIGNATGTVGISMSNTDFVITSTTCGVTLKAGASCIANVALRPVGFGSRTGTFIVTSTAAGSPFNVTLSGTGCRPPSAGSSRLGAKFTCSQ